MTHKPVGLFDDNTFNAFCFFDNNVGRVDPDGMANCLEVGP